MFPPASICTSLRESVSFRIANPALSTPGICPFTLNTSDPAPCEVKVILAVPDDGLIANAPVIVPPANGSFAAIELVTVVEKLASSPIAAASSLSVSKAEGAEATRLDTAVLTNAVVASLVVLLPAD